MEGFPDEKDGQMDREPYPVPDSKESWQVSEFLSVCIPSRNRASLLRDLLRSIGREIRSHALTPRDVRVYVFDNASTDHTTRVYSEETEGLGSFFQYARHPQNIGPAGNQLLCARTGGGLYRWVIGDDEILADGALAYVLDLLRREAPAWMIVTDGKGYGRGLNPPEWFEDVSDFVRVANRKDPEVLMTAGGWSMNIFRFDCFDHGLAAQLADSSTYPHFFGMMRALKNRGGRVFFAGCPIVLFREQRPLPSDHELPADSDGNWRRCLEWLREEFNEPGIDPESQSKAVSRRMIQEAMRHPWRALRNQGRLFLIPGTWVRVVRRVWFFFQR